MTGRLAALFLTLQLAAPAPLSFDVASIKENESDETGPAAMLPVLEQRASVGDIARGELALLTDRVLVRSGKPQRYGSAFSIVSGRLIADPIEDEANVDARRAAVGLPSMAEYARLLAQLNGLPVEWPRR